MKKRRRVLVTGANGYIGRHVVKELLTRGCQVIACDKVLNDMPEAAEPLIIDVLNSDNDIYTLANKPDCLIHLAWRNNFCHNADTHMKDLPLHIEFLQQMIDAGVESVSVIGSMHEIGYCEGAIKADTEAKPQSFYGISKNTLRQAMEVITSKNNVYFHWLRVFYIYGDDKKNNSVLSKILFADKNGHEYFPFTSGKNLYDFLHVDDLAKQIVAAALQTKYTGTINCCSGKPVSLGSMAEKFIYDNKLKIKLQYNVFPQRPYDSPGVWGDATMIHKILEEERVVV